MFAGQRYHENQEGAGANALKMGGVEATFPVGFVRETHFSPLKLKGCSPCSHVDVTKTARQKVSSRTAHAVLGMEGRFS